MALTLQPVHGCDAERHRQVENIMKKNRTKTERRPCTFAIAGPLGSRVSYQGDELTSVRVRFTSGRNSVTGSALEQIRAIMIAGGQRKKTTPQINRHGGVCWHIRPEVAEKTIRGILEAITLDFMRQFGPHPAAGMSAKPVQGVRP